MRYITNAYCGRRFFKEGRDWIVAWNDEEYLRAAPEDDPTGLKFVAFKIEDLEFFDH